jgi:hypothetical protein
MEKYVTIFILVVDWPVLILMSILIARRERSFYKKLKGTVIGKLITPTVFGWLFGMYALGIVASAYMICIPWYFAVIPAFLLFLIAIIIVLPGYENLGEGGK